MTRAFARGLLVVLLFLLAGCGAGTTASLPSTASAPTNAPAAPVASEAAAKPVKLVKVVTTMSILADMIKNVGGEHVAVENIIPLGAGPEDYQPTPQDAQKIAGADIVFFNGHGLEAWLDDLFKSAATPGQPQIAVSEALQAVDVGSTDFREGNPHFWMSAANGATYVEQIRDGLILVDPANKAVYTTNADAYIKQLLALNAELKQQAERIPQAQRKLVTNHDAFPYFAQEYGFVIVGNILGSPESAPSAGDLAALVQNIKAQKVKAIFSESQFSPKLSKTIADEAGVQIVADLYTDTLGDASSGGATYIDMLRFDMQTIVDALQ